WTSWIWIGTTLGLVTGIVFHFAASKLPRVPTLIENFEPRPAAAVQTVALCMLGGVIANFTGSRGTRSAGDEKPPHDLATGSPARLAVIGGMLMVIPLLICAAFFAAPHFIGDPKFTRRIFEYGFAPM